MTPEAGWTSTSAWPQSLANAVRGTALGGLILALIGFIVALLGDYTLLVSLPAAVVLGTLMAVPPTLAMLSYPDRPRLLLAAGLTGLLGLYGSLSILGLPLMVLGAIWVGAFIKLAPRVDWGRTLAMIIVPVLWLVASAAMTAHLDPVCEQRLRDGRVIRVDPAARGFETGWAWEVGSEFSGSSGGSEDVLSEVCSGDMVVGWEALAAMGLSGAAVGVGVVLAKPDEE
jgi:hypothetical protein